MKESKTVPYITRLEIAVFELTAKNELFVKGVEKAIKCVKWIDKNQSHGVSHACDELGEDLQILLDEKENK